jgi:hypothetical protein
MGFRPPELCSSRAAVRRLRRRYPPAVGGGTAGDRSTGSDETEATSQDETEATSQDATEATPTHQRSSHPDRPRRLQGLAPHESPPRDRGCLRHEPRVALLGFRPPGCSPSPEWHDFHRASPHGLGPADRTRPRGLPSRVSLPARLARLSRDRRPSWASSPRDHHGHSIRNRFGSRLLRPRGASPFPASLL